ncbi:hypothetical protein A2955_01495 [Candidatus Woesebacteria bacterium RIFCSPLOWO2_01_FULL_37_19]|uniref:HTH cro/C1-type domain-containing protein n=2 Tax=Candidatus Woeseibacteriota TaxID=1752722 RepID=A0A1F8B7L0_9BACT|nr:MAG: hypothetical protein A2771_00315 [Candidatus Woesebacteria bacterium RIFCSPHIGHO2_01_FULL_38_26b]OGM60026.1 MAG: hypothetical protein A2955_01495 [Candidatus Woesebacteria bacterium RIFCSPLOWO2_01_FULL_37_19]
MNMKSWKILKKELLEDGKVAREYNRLEPRYQIISELIELRKKKGLTQKDLAYKIGTKQAAIARIESGRVNPTVSSLEKIASALDTKLIIQFKS